MFSLFFLRLANVGIDWGRDTAGAVVRPYGIGKLISKSQAKAQDGRCGPQVPQNVGDTGAEVAGGGAPPLAEC